MKIKLKNGSSITDIPTNNDSFRSSRHKHILLRTEYGVIDLYYLKEILEEFKEDEMVDKKTWKEFRECGMLWWINMVLHTFGWAIVCNMEGDEVTDAYPARVKFRGFDEKNNDEGYTKVTKYLKENADVLMSEVEG